MTFTITTDCIKTPTGDLKVPPKACSLQLSVVVPTFNERKNIQPILSQLTAALDQVLPDQYEVIVVDDDSPDETWLFAKESTVRFPALKVMRRQEEHGLATAVIRGWQAAEGEFLGVIDADLQHPPETLLELLEKLTTGADLAVASRHVAGGGVSQWSLIRRGLSRGAQLIGLLLLPDVVSRVNDPMSGYFLVKRNAISSVNLDPLGYKLLIEIIGRGRIQKIEEVGYVFQERAAETSKVDRSQYVNYIRHLLKLRSRTNVSHFQNISFPIKRFLQYGIVGLTGVAVDMAILYFLSDPHALGWGLTRSKMIAAEVAIFNNFLWNDVWTFADHSQSQPEYLSRITRFLKFNAICLIGLFLNIFLLNFLFNIVFDHRYRYLANLISILAITGFNFGLNLKLNWRTTRSQETVGDG